MTWHEWDEDVQQAALDGARDAYRRWHAVTDLADLQQEAQIYIATHVQTIAERQHDLGLVRAHVRDRLMQLMSRREQKDPVDWSVPLEEIVFEL